MIRHSKLIPYICPMCMNTFYVQKKDTYVYSLYINRKKTFFCSGKCLREFKKEQKKTRILF